MHHVPGHGSLRPPRLSAGDVVLSHDEHHTAAQAGRFDLILDTVGAPHAREPYTRALAIDGTVCLVGIPEGSCVFVLAR